MLINSIIQNTQAAKKILNQIRDLPGKSLTEEALLESLQKAICLKLMIPETSETNLKILLITSIHTADAAMEQRSPEQAELLMHKTDCHRVSLLAHKKVLLIMFIEKELNLKFTNEEASSIEDTKDLALLAADYLKRSALSVGGSHS